MKISDYHIHSYYSSDSSETPENIVKAAIDKGLYSICFTDHMDLDWPESMREPIEDEMGTDGQILKRKLNRLSANEKLPIFTFNPEGYFAELTALRKKYEGKIDIKIGAEFGLRPERPDLVKEYEYLRKHYKFDFCLGSLHLVDDKDPCFSDNWTCDYDDYIDEYFFELQQAVHEYESFDSLAHIDYIARYLPTMEDMKNDRELINEFADSLYEKHSHSIDDILKTIIRRKVALEINTGGAGKTYGHVHPTKEILEKYHAFGGDRHTFGSDAHVASRVGEGLANLTFYKDL